MQSSRSFTLALFLVFASSGLQPFLVAQNALAFPPGPSPIRAAVPGWLPDTLGVDGLSALWPVPSRKPFVRAEPGILRNSARIPASYSPATSVFYEATPYSSDGSYAESVAVADVNGDGNLDLVVTDQCNTACTGQGVVAVLLGNGDGTFQKAVIYHSGGYNAFGLALADVNGDGRPDVIVTNECATTSCTNSSVSILLGNGDGTFQKAVNYNSGGYSSFSVTIADVNGDGKPDVVVTNRCINENGCQTSGNVGVLLGKGNGTFQNVVTYSSGGQQAVSVAVGDVNSDGKPDLIVANQCADSSCVTGSVAILLGNGSGNFLAAVSYSSGGEAAAFVAVADINGDGKPDLLVANDLCDEGCLTGDVGILLGNGDGTFQAAVSYSSNGPDTSSVAVADVNADGKPDLLLTNNCTTPGAACVTGTLAVLLGNGDGTFQPASTFDSAGTEASKVVIADVNNDSKLDAVVLNTCGTNGDYSCTLGSIGILLGNGVGTFQAARTYSTDGYDPQAPVIADLNGDGNPDLVIPNQCQTESNCAGQVSVQLGNGDGTFQPAALYNSNALEAEAVAIADVNADGKLDLVIANQCANSVCNNGNVAILLGNGDGTFQPAVNYAVQGFPVAIAIADINLDGKPDVVVTGDNNSVELLLGNGNATFQSPIEISTGQFGESLAIADVNFDGNPDILVANNGNGSANSGSLTVLLGNGNGTFQSPVLYNTNAIYTDALAVADLNHDGKLDLIVASVYDNTSTYGVVGTLLGNGDGTFQPVVNVTTPTPMGGLRSIAIADFNGDRKPDLAIGAGNILLLGKGNGTFQKPLTLGAGGPGIASADFNLDGRPDLAVGGVTILLNIDLQSTTTTVSSTPDPSIFGQLVTLTAKVSFNNGSAPSGTVNFFDGDTQLCTAPLSASTSEAIFQTSSLALGTHKITAQYGGNSYFAASQSNVRVQTVK